MKRAYFICLFLCLTTSLLSQSNPVSVINQTARVTSPISASQPDPQAQARILDGYGKLPLSFEANQGQSDARVKFLSRTGGYTLFLTGDEAVFAWSGKKTKKTSPQGLKPVSMAGLSGTAEAMPFPKTVSEKSSAKTAPAADRATGGVLRMKLRNANRAAKVTGVDEQAGTSNYFIGNDPAKWRTNVTTYAKVKYEEIYSGIDLVYYGNQRQLEYDFIVAPGADPRRIAFDVRGAMRIRRDEHGDLVLKMVDGEIRWHKPVVYQEKDGTRQEIAARYAITETNRVGFELAKYDASKPLYIDPLIYSTYLGGSSIDKGYGIAVDGAGNAYVTGHVNSLDFPTTPGALQTTCGDTIIGCALGDAFVAKLNPSGSALVYSTYLGGSNEDFGYGIAVDGTGNAYVTGRTFSTDFPTTPGAFQTAFRGHGNAFITKFNTTGSALVYSTYLGGSGGYNGMFYFGDEGYGIAVDSSGNAYITGFTGSTDFPITPDAFQTALRAHGGNAFITKFNTTGSALVYSTYLGGSGYYSGNFYFGDGGYGIAVDSSGNAYVTGQTVSMDFPITPGAFQTVCGCNSVDGDAFVTKLNPTGSALAYSTYLGGSGPYGDYGTGIAVDSSGNAYVTGAAESGDFPTTSGAFQATCGGGGDFNPCSDAFVTKVNPNGSALVYSTYLGGQDQDWGMGITVDSSGHAYVIGYTDSDNFPTKYPLQPYSNSNSRDAFVTKLNPKGSALAYSTYLGPAGNIKYFDLKGSGIAVDSLGNAYVTGWTMSPAFPTMIPLQPFSLGGYSAFVAKISAGPSDITLSPLHLNFSGQPTGVVSNPQVSVLNNTGSTSLTITSISVTGTNSGDFAQTNNCGATLQPGTSCSITVTFTPTAIGNRSAAVKIVDSAPRQWVSLTGLGLLETVTKLTSNKNPSALGQWVTFRATVSSPSGGTPTGYVSFRDGTTTLAKKELSAGTATIVAKTLPLGLNIITAYYWGNSNYGFSTSAPVNQYVLEGSTTTALTSSPNPSIYGQAVTFTAVVTSSLDAPPPDGETVTFMKGTKVLGTGTLSGGSASFTTSTLPGGANYIKAAYVGDANFAPSTSKGRLNQAVNKATTTTTLASSLNPSNVGQSVTFTASVAPQFGGTVTGYVTFYDGTTALKTNYMSGGVAKYTTSILTSGSHSITATFNGGTNFTGSSASLTQKVN